MIKKRFVLSGYFGFKNFGDEAILSVIVNKLLSERNALTVISSDPKYTKTMYKHIRSIYTFDFNSIIPSIYKSDILISGGGSLLQDVTSIKSLVYYLLIIFIALIFKKKVIIFAQGIGPINSNIGRFLTKNILRHCFYISVRDKKSQELLANWGIKSDLLCDPIFSIKIPSFTKNKTLAIQLRSCKGLTNDFIDRLADSINNNFKDYNIEIYSFQDEIDLEICKNLEKNISMLNPDINTIVYSGLTNEEIIEKISKVEYLISMRFHALIIGLLSGAKILGINYDIKVEKLSQEYNFPLIDLKEDFQNNFSLLKNQRPVNLKDKLANINFDWAGFDKAIL